MHAPASPAHSAAPAFQALERALLRRRFEQTDLRLRVEILAIAVLIGMFVLWQVRVPLDGLARAAGPWAAARRLAAGALLVALAGGLLAGIRHAHRLRAPGGPPWLALPIAPRALAAHIAWGSRLTTWWLAVPVLAALIAAIGLVPPLAIALIAIGFPVALDLATRAGTMVAFAIVAGALSPDGSGARRHAIESLLAAGATDDRAHRLPAASWAARPAWVALWRKDLTVTRRPTRAQQRARTLLLAVALSAIVWRLPLESGAMHLLAFGLALASAAALAEWLVELSAADPFMVLRGLPLGVGALWTARVAWAVLGAALLVLLHALAAPALPPPALRVYMVWIGCAALGLGVLGAQYGITLFPRAHQAHQVLALTLGLALVASIAIPLLGWVLLLAALIHSARRLPRWSRSEAV
jgi:hypothetical protein